MTIKQFIEKVIKGKYHIHGTPFESENNKIISIDSDTKENTIFINYEWNNEGKISYPQANILIDQKLIHEMVLDPKAWEAVARSYQFDKDIYTPKDEQDIKDIAQAKMHMMIDALCADKSIEKYLETL